MAHCFAEVGVPNRYLRLPVFAPIDGHNGRMRYLIALIVGIVALFVVNAFTGIFSLPRPWNSLSMGGIVGITMVIILLIWETVRPSQREGIPGAPRMSDEERAQARADRRARLAAEAGVRDDSSSESAGPRPRAGLRTTRRPPPPGLRTPRRPLPPPGLRTHRPPGPRSRTRRA
ncbi:pro-sigmaK processing inhibitor BofA family protein [Brevibacterium casei]|nr:pro-sigmaK processing inhibitor BofA family protein [Brevibacterium casei]